MALSSGSIAYSIGATCALAIFKFLHSAIFIFQFGWLSFLLSLLAICDSRLAGFNILQFAICNLHFAIFNTCFTLFCFLAPSFLSFNLYPLAFILPPAL
jgi:hypothetical protein